MRAEPTRRDFLCVGAAAAAAMCGGNAEPPIGIMVVPPAPPQDRAILMAAIHRLASDSGVVIPESMGIEVHAPGGRGGRA